MILTLIMVLGLLVYGWGHLDYSTRFRYLSAFWTLLAGAALAGTILTLLSGGRVFMPESSQSVSTGLY